MLNIIGFIHPNLNEILKHVDSMNDFINAQYAHRLRDGTRQVSNPASLSFAVNGISLTMTKEIKH